MTHKNLGRISILAGIVLLGGSSFAKDITLFDNQGPGWGKAANGSQSNWSTWGGLGPTVHDVNVKEDNEVEPASLAGQVWDLEALVWNTSTKWNNATKSLVSSGGTPTLGILGGYNMVNGQDGYLPGDIFISVDGNPNPTISNQTQGYHNVNNRTTGAGATFANPTDSNGLGYEYVIHFDNYSGDTRGIGAGQFTVYKLTANSVLRSVRYNENQQSNPWRYNGGTANGAIVVGTGTTSWSTGINNTQATAISVGSGSDLSDLAGLRTIKGDIGLTASHNYLEIPMGWMFNNPLVTPAITSLGGHITMGCGNDELTGAVTFSNTVVPDAGASALSLAIGLGGLAAFRRKVAGR